MTAKKYDAPLALDMDFAEAVTRFAGIKPHEVKQVMKDSKEGRVRESDLILPSLRLMSERAGGFIATSELITELQALFNPTDHDAQIIEGRADTFFSQKVRNLASHRDSGNSFIANGYAEYDAELHGFRITAAGRSLLKMLNG